jgi:hypothetical protein
MKRIVSLIVSLCVAVTLTTLWVGCFLLPDDGGNRRVSVLFSDSLDVPWKVRLLRDTAGDSVGLMVPVSDTYRILNDTLATFDPDSAGVLTLHFRTDSTNIRYVATASDSLSGLVRVDRWVASSDCWIALTARVKVQSGGDSIEVPLVFDAPVMRGGQAKFPIDLEASRPKGFTGFNPYDNPVRGTYALHCIEVRRPE